MPITSARGLLRRWLYCLVTTLTVTLWMAEVEARGADVEGGPTGPCAALGTVCVGAGDRCQYHDLQDAIDAAATGSSDHTTILVANDQTYSNPPLAIENRNLTLRGGYSSCGTFTSSGRTVLHGWGLGSRVMTIDSDAGSRDVRLENLELRDGGPADLHHEMNGGGLLISGDVAVELRDSTVAHNSAVHGGGIYLDGHDGAELSLTQGSEIVDNVAENGQYDGHVSGTGAGLHCVGGGSVTMDGGQILGNVAVTDDEATGGASAGGGIYLDGCSMEATADGDLSGVRANIASGGFGGGLCLTNSASVILRSSGASPFPVAGNIAGQDGGGFYVTAQSAATVHGAAIDNNIAGFDGGLLGDGGGAAVFGSAFVMDNLGCTACASFKGNTAQSGAVIYGYGSSTTIPDAIVVYDARITQNSATTDYGNLFDIGDFFFPIDEHVFLANDLVTHNSAIGMLSFSASAEGRFSITSTTIADNVFSEVMYYPPGGPGPTELDNSIVHETDTLFAPDFNTVDMDCVLLDPDSAVPPGATVAIGDPGFVDGANGDYHLRADSAAIDFCTDIDGVPGIPELDLDGHPRGVDAPDVPPFLPGATYDLGAYEWTAVYDVIFVDGFEP